VDNGTFFLLSLSLTKGKGKEEAERERVLFETPFLKGVYTQGVSKRKRKAQRSLPNGRRKKKNKTLFISAR